MPTTFDRVDLACPNTDPTQWPKLSCGAASQLALHDSSLRLEVNRELLFQDGGQIRSFDDTHKLVFDRPSNLLELHELGSIRFLTGGPTPSEKVRIGADGRVGIGTTSPAEPLEVNGRIKSGALTIGPWPANPNRYMFFGTNALNQADAGNYALLQAAANVDQGVTYLNSPVSIHFRIRNGDQMVLANNGNVGIGTSSPASRLHVNGDIRFTGNLFGGGKGGYVMDQFVNGLGEALEQGDVVVVGAAQPSLSYGPNNNIPIPEIEVAQRGYDTRVCGIVSEVYGELRSEAEHAATPGIRATPAEPPHAFTPEELAQRDRTEVKAGQLGWMVTLGAFAHCKVDADIAPITAGDLLTTSSTTGHAQKVLDSSKAVGAIIGKALGSLNTGKGKIPVLVLLH